MFENREFAELIAKLGEQCGAALNEMAHGGEEHLSAERLKEFRRRVGTVMASLSTQLMIPLYARHPELEKISE